MKRGGIDEVGRGPLAGPVVVAAVVFDDRTPALGFRDSKKLSFSSIVKAAEQVKASALAWSIVEIPAVVIDEINILEATRLGMGLAAHQLQADIWYIDGNMGFVSSVEQHCVIGGDGKVVEISAASNIAKHHRDLLMRKLAERYVEYGFEKHVGYPTKAHKEAVLTHGVTGIHRRSFRGVDQKAAKSREEEQLYRESPICIYSHSLQKRREQNFNGKLRSFWRELCSKNIAA